ncbi:DNA polymerase epsilon subunit B [Cocos nucifera]|uniref:DNA polymerase II subunit 2 n=1 Tax=Cocos nucifera TaxID=13894 RepID=A0A8K0MXX2_COCNU|nr:DNA polymerase epsilon subunit B [Cocos nucifera]
MGAAGTRKKVQRKFKLRGFTFKVEALEEALAFLSRFPDAEDDALDLLIDEIDKESLKSSILDREAIHRVVSLLLDADAAVDPSCTVASNRAALRVIDAFVIPRFRYDPIKKVFYEHTGRLPIHGEAGDKAALYRDRYQLLLQRLSRDKYFSRPAFDTEITDSDSCETIRVLYPERLKEKEEISKFPLHPYYSLLQKLVFFFHDLNILLSIKSFSGTMSIHVGFHRWRIEKIHCHYSWDLTSLVVVYCQQKKILSGLEKKAVNDMFVILSDVWLDNDEFGKLGEMIEARPRLKEQSRFLFIPGPDDADLTAFVIFCRIKFYTQEIVFFRQDLLYRMRRSSLIPPSTEETSDPFEHLVATITHQGHLCPLPLTVQPIIWNYDHCLQLYPTPHTIVLGDRNEQKAFKYTGITCFNPGSFSNDSTFAAYRPCTKEVELSALES